MPKYVKAKEFEIMDSITLRHLADKIEQNQANLDDYFEFEKLLNLGGLNHNFILNYLNKAGFGDWEAFYQARSKKKNSEIVGGVVVGGLLGMAAAVLINALQEN